MNNKQYYTAPSDEVFNGIKEAAIKIWRTYDDSNDYATGKINSIKDLQNIRDNTCYIVAMFDQNNQRKLLLCTEGKTKEWLKNLLFNNLT